jgi:uncharacterized protein YidB (DUF937 family)
MGLLNDILKEVAGGALTPDNHNQLFDTVVGMLTNPQSGGLPGLLENFKKKGLGDIFASWISTGQNLPVSPAQIQQALGKGQVQQIAQKTGLGKSDVADALSKLMPEIVDKLTPKGTIRPEDLKGEGLNVLKQLFG